MDNKPAMRPEPPSPIAVLDLEKRDPRQAEALWNGLSRLQRLRVILEAQGADRERLIVLAADAPQLVRALAVDEFAHTVLGLGPEDAGQLIAMSTDEQLTYLLDLTGWVAERLAPARYEAWVPIIMEGGARRTLRWLESMDIETLALMMAHWFRVVKWLPSQDEQEPPDDLPSFTVDGVYHIDFLHQGMRDYSVQILALLRNENPDLYIRALEAMLWEGASAMAEDAAKWRSGRLADLGFPTREEAFELWAKARPGEDRWHDLPTKGEMGFLADAPPRSDGALGLLPADEALPVAVGAMDDAALDRLRAELVYVANCGVVALGADPTDPEAVTMAARESLGLVNLGLALLSGGEASEARRIVARLGLSVLARRGAAEIRVLNRRAWAVFGEGWLATAPGGLEILDQPLDRWLAGLLFPRPRCYDPTMGQGREYRAFLGLADVTQADFYLSRAELWGELLELMGIGAAQMAALVVDHGDDAPPRPKLTAVIGTWLAAGELGLPLEPLLPDMLGPAVRAIQQGLGGELEARLMDLARSLADGPKAALAADMLRGVLAALADDLGRLDPAAEVDGRFIQTLVVSQ